MNFNMFALTRVENPGRYLMVEPITLKVLLFFTNSDSHEADSFSIIVENLIDSNIMTKELNNSSYWRSIAITLDIKGIVCSRLNGTVLSKSGQNRKK